jgi:hypothetical protein
MKKMPSMNHIKVMDIENEECMRTSVHLNAYNNHAFLTPIDRKDKIILVLIEENFWVILH